MKLILAISLVSLSAHAGIFGADDRAEALVETDLARATPALVRKSMLEFTDGLFRAKASGLEKSGLCQDVRFMGQPALANCSASLVGPDLVLTAAHCLEDYPTREGRCDQYHVVFDYAQEGETRSFRPDQVYGCKKIEYYRYDEWNDREDLALIRLDRKVSDRTPIKLNFSPVKVGSSVSLLGYPFGLPLKSVNDGQVSAVNSEKLSFRHTLDTFSCNSGGPVFNDEGEQVGVVVRATSPNMSPRVGQTCYDWGIAKGSDWSEANSIGHLKKFIRLISD